MSKIPKALWATISNDPMPDDMDYETFRLIRMGKWKKESIDENIRQIKFFLALKKRSNSEQRKSKIDVILKKLMA